MVHRRSGPRHDEAVSPARRFGVLGIAFQLVGRASPRWLTLSIAVSVIAGAAVALQLLVGRHLLNLISAEGEVGFADLAPHLALLAVLLFASVTCETVNREARLMLSEKVSRLAMNEILDVAAEVDYEAYEGVEFHDRLQRARVAAGGQSSAVVFGVITILSTAMVTIGVIGVLAKVVPFLLPIALVGYVPMALVNVYNTRAHYGFERELTELQRERTYLEVLMTERVLAKELRAYDTGPTLRRWHNELWGERIARLGVLVRQRLTRSALGSLMSSAALVATVSVVLVLAGRGSISVGDAGVAVIGLQQLNGRIQSVGASLNGVHTGMTFLRDFETFRASLPEIRRRRGTTPPPAPPTTLRLEDVGYRYPGAVDDAVRGVSFELRRGQTMAIVGANGSGKSTLAKLVCALLTPTRGRITWDGVDLASCDPALVRAQVAPVFQDFVPYMLTMRRAIGLGDASRLDDDAAIGEAARQAGLQELIERLPAGIDTRLGKAFQDGIDISGGQWQRLAIARALFRDAPVVVLDEPSASLDPRGEAELFDLLQQLCADRLVIFVSHRFATVRSADVVMVVDDGSVVEIGSHDELMAAHGMYHDLYRLQASRYGSD